MRLLKIQLIRHVKGSWAAARTDTQTFWWMHGLNSATDGIVSKLLTDASKQCKHLKAACGLRGKSFSFFLPWLGSSWDKVKTCFFQLHFFFFFLNFVAALAVQLSMPPFLMKCVKCLGLNYCLAKWFFSLTGSLYDLPYWEGIQGETLHVCHLHTYVNK